mmetsp:Transcript_111161/g.313686  ORF Transcript_111161/g.313686 Transcript_111161/m.313686 type:complete len:301 (-) Transcript_111161:213-1115(-)
MRRVHIDVRLPPVLLGLLDTRDRVIHTTLKELNRSGRAFWRSKRVCDGLGDALHVAVVRPLIPVREVAAVVSADEEHVALGVALYRPRRCHVDVLVFEAELFGRPVGAHVGDEVVQDPQLHRSRRRLAGIVAPLLVPQVPAWLAMLPRPDARRQRGERCWRGGGEDRKKALRAVVPSQEAPSVQMVLQDVATHPVAEYNYDVASLHAADLCCEFPCLGLADAASWSKAATEGQAMCEIREAGTFPFNASQWMEEPPVVEQALEAPQVGARYVAASATASSPAGEEADSEKARAGASRKAH